MNERQLITKLGNRYTLKKNRICNNICEQAYLTRKNFNFFN